MERWHTNRTFGNSVSQKKIQKILWTRLNSIAEIFKEIYLH